jgi:cell division septal protein FtsQ
MQAPDLDTRVTRMEKEHHNLAARLKTLEKQRRSSLPAFLAHVILLVSAGLLIGYLGFYPAWVDRLPLQARKVEAEEYLLRSKDGTILARLIITNDGFRFEDEQGNTLFSKP